MAVQRDETVRAVARVNLAAIERNVARMRRAFAAGTRPTALCAVVKADGYGHGALPAALAALAGGASWLAVVAADEAALLRQAGIDAPILVMGALAPRELDVALAARADVVAWDEGFVSAVGARGGGAVHVKLDTGMGRLGTRDPAVATRVAEAALATDGVRLAGAMTHFATADERGDAFFGEQLDRFEVWARPLQAAHPALLLHAANSAATLRDPAAHFDMVRSGVAIYGLDPFGADARASGLEAALELHSYVAAVKAVGAGESAGYGRRFVATVPTHTATVPIGYGDGVRRGLTNNADALVRGSRHALVGTVSMDNVTLDVGSAAAAAVGDEVVLIGAQGEERISAEEMAQRLATINYEVTCGLLPRVPRRYHRDGEPVQVTPPADRTDR
ncbi:MAG TPA: alanine racemase [Solirubrobacteraceae bacterium]|jgi:alanine racemase|nr:alanine racemase [Solirubrobacteraceae bacterium]